MSPPEQSGRDARAVVLVLTGIAAGILYSNFVIDVVLSGRKEMLAVVSDLEAPGAPNAGLLRVTEVLCALLTLALLPFVRAALPAGKARAAAIWLTAVFAVGNAVAGIITLPCPSGTPDCDATSQVVQRWIHDGFSIVSVTALFLGAVAIALDTGRQGPRWLHRAGWLTFWIGGVLGTVLFGVFGYLDSTSWETGVSQRIQLGVMSVWLGCLGVYAATHGLRAWDRRRTGEGVGTG